MVSALPFLFYFSIWKVHLITQHVSNPILTGDVTLRFVDRMQKVSDLLRIGVTALGITWPYLPFFALFLLYCYVRRLPKRLLVISLMPAVYSLLASVSYLVTPYDLAWHLGNSADRVYLVFNVCAMAVCAGLVQIEFEGSVAGFKFKRAR